MGLKKYIPAAHLPIVCL